MAESDSKTCPDCRQLLPISNFPKYSGCAGRNRRCSKCLNERRKKNEAAWSPERRAKAASERRGHKAKWKAANRAQTAAYYEQNKEYIKAKVAKWRQDNPDRLRELSRGWRHTRRSRQAGGATAAEEAEWVARQKKVCHWCGKRCCKSFHIDHIQPLSKDGKHELRNLCIACPSCNLRKGDKDPIDFAQRIGKLL